MTRSVARCLVAACVLSACAAITPAPTPDSAPTPVLAPVAEPSPAPTSVSTPVAEPGPAPAPLPPPDAINLDAETQALIAKAKRTVFLIPFSHWDTDWHDAFPAYSRQNATLGQYAIDRVGRTFPPSLGLIAAESGIVADLYRSGDQIEAVVLDYDPATPATITSGDIRVTLPAAALTVVAPGLR